MPQTIAILGASLDPSRYSNRACKILHDLGHTVYAVSLHGNPFRFRVSRFAFPPRVIFNPGTESEPTEHALHAAHIPTLHACTLVMASTGQF